LIPPTRSICQCAKSSSIPKPPAWIPCAAIGWSRSAVVQRCCNRMPTGGGPSTDTLIPKAGEMPGGRKPVPCMGSTPVLRAKAVFAAKWSIDDFLEFIAEDAPPARHPQPRFRTSVLHQCRARPAIKGRRIARERLFGTSYMLARRKIRAVEPDRRALSPLRDRQFAPPHQARALARTLSFRRSLHRSDRTARQSQLICASETRVT